MLKWNLEYESDRNLKNNFIENEFISISDFDQLLELDAD